MQYDADKKCEEYSLLCLLKQTTTYLSTHYIEWQSQTPSAHMVCRSYNRVSKRPVIFSMCDVKGALKLVIFDGIL